MKSSILIIGSGLGGLAAALRLRKAGYEVTVLEKNASMGGKAQELRLNGYRWDMGPSLLTLPHVVDELFTDLGKHREDYLEFIPLPTLCRYFWEDGFTIDEDEAFYQSEEMKAFIAEGQKAYEVSESIFLKSAPCDWWKIIPMMGIKRMIDSMTMNPLKKMNSRVKELITETHLQQLCNRFATYNGSSPYLTPSTFNVIGYVQKQFGGWYIKGGIRELPKALEKLCFEMGVNIITNAQVDRLDETGVHTTDSRTFTADHYIVNGDVIRAHRDWIRLSGWEEEVETLEKPTRALSGFVIYLGVKKRYEQLQTHNIFFSPDYEKEFKEMFDEKRPASDPTIYLHMTSRLDEQDAPSGCDNYFLLINAPAEIKSIDWEVEKEKYADLIIRRLEEKGLKELSKHIEIKKIFTPQDFADRDLTTHGSLYGWASHDLKTSFLRPSIQSKLAKNVFFVGGTTHPGGGMPMVLLGAKMVFEKILRQ